MSKISKMILVAIAAAFIGGLGVYLWQIDKSTTGATKYNCELSGGSFNNGACDCALEGEQIQEEMYDESTGFCQSSIGGPAGDAFPASVGLPWGNFSSWTEIIGNNCSETGGDWLNARCTCDGGLTYDQETGYCK